MSHKNVLPLRIGVQVLLRPPLRLIDDFGKNQQRRNRLQMPGLVIHQHHGPTTTDAKVHKILPRPFLGHDFLSQIASRSTYQIGPDLGIRILERKNGFADARA